MDGGSQPLIQLPNTESPRQSRYLCAIRASDHNADLGIPPRQEAIGIGYSYNLFSKSEKRGGGGVFGFFRNTLLLPRHKKHCHCQKEMAI